MTAPTDDLLDNVTAIIDSFVWQRQGPRVAGLAVLGQPYIADALALVPVVAQLDAQHQPRRWGDQSDVVVCDTCQTAFPCAVRDVLDGPQP